VEAIADSAISPPYKRPGTIIGCWVKAVVANNILTDKVPSKMLVLLFFIKTYS